ncbi:SRPBCC family protein [Roseateles sp.]|uniref:SRPBCC family protein n=1 Tax=Roseateles sp. TaxID=1971397 RepID=UPI0039EA58A9
MTVAPSVAREYLLEAPVEAVFDAWTDASALLQWWCAGNAHATHADLDVRQGGRYEIRMSPGPAGTPQIVRGLYVKVERPHRLVMTWRAEGTPHDNGDDSLLTVELFAHGRGTRLTLLHERLPAASPPSYAQGWAHVLHALSRFLGPR